MRLPPSVRSDENAARSRRLRACSSVGAARCRSSGKTSPLGVWSGGGGRAPSLTPAPIRWLRGDSAGVARALGRGLPRAGKAAASRVSVQGRGHVMFGFRRSSSDRNAAAHARATARDGGCGAAEEVSSPALRHATRELRDTSARRCLRRRPTIGRRQRRLSPASFRWAELGPNSS